TAVVRTADGGKLVAVVIGDAQTGTIEPHAFADDLAERTECLRQLGHALDGATDRPAPFFECVAGERHDRLRAGRNLFHGRNRCLLAAAWTAVAQSADRFGDLFR